MAEPSATHTFVILVDCPRLADPLAELEMRVETELSLTALLSPKLTRDARAIVLSERAFAEHDVGVAIRRLRETWPLVDIIVWGHGADTNFVRTALQAGAKDVFLTGSPDICARGVLNVIESQQLMPRAAKIGYERDRAAVFEGMLSRSRRMWDMFDVVSRIAGTSAAVLILGETGTGKELLARAIHRLSKRKGRFVAMNCAAVSEQLIDSELFGHVEGAFTGALRDKEGLFRHADGGTLMLDEIGHIAPAAQHRLLRTLQEGMVRPVGAHTEVSVDVRIVAATSNRLEAQVEANKFRQDLFFRLDVIRLEIPPLRERPEDIIFLFSHFSRDFSRQYDVPRPEVSDLFLDRLLAYDWPGNVRQLENFTERMVLTHMHDEQVTADHFEKLLPFQRGKRAEIRRTVQPSRPQSETTTEVSSIDGAASPRGEIDLSKSLEENLRPSVERIERDYLEACLRQCRGRMNQAAELADISRRTLLRKLKQYGIDKAVFRKCDSK